VVAAPPTAILLKYCSSGRIATQRDGRRRSLAGGPGFVPQGGMIGADARLDWTERPQPESNERCRLMRSGGAEQREEAEGSTTNKLV
jgi:hypothetical protein